MSSAARDNVAAVKGMSPSVKGRPGPVKNDDVERRPAGTGETQPTATRR